MRNEFTYMGPYVENIARRLEPDFREYIRKDGTKGPIQHRPENVDGLFIGIMEEQPRRFWAVAVHDPSSGEFVYPKQPLLLDLPKHTDGKSFGPHNNTICTDGAAQRLLEDLIELNPEQEELVQLAATFTTKDRRSVSHEQRAGQVWDALTAHAPTRRPLTYSELAERVHAYHRVLGRPLYLIQEHCLDRYPPLTAIVVTAHGGRPSDGFTAWDGGSLEDVQRQVYDFDWRCLPNPFRYALEGETEASLAHRLVTDPDASASVYQLVRARGPAQAIFRNALRQAYASRCAFCGLTIAAALDAAHIHPWAKASHAQRLDVRNGLLLCSNHHRLFDAGLLTLTEDHTVAYTPASPPAALSDADRALTLALHGIKLHLPQRRHLWPDPALIRLRNTPA